jgi:hypothetical protein
MLGAMRCATASNVLLGPDLQRLQWDLSLAAVAVAVVMATRMTA